MFDFLKNFQNMQLGDPTSLAPKGEGGWQTGVQAEGSPISMTTDGAFAGFNPKVSDLGRAMQGAAEQMPGGAQMNQMWGPGARGTGPKDLGRILATSGPPGVQNGGGAISDGPYQTNAKPAAAPQGAFSPPSSGPASWLKPFTGA